jgi:two-component sensor histidine kinase
MDALYGLEGEAVSVNRRRLSWLVLTAATLLVAALGVSLTIAGHRRDALPYHDSFGKNIAGEWMPLGGMWDVDDGAIYNRSDERGAKLVTGSAEWSNYALDTDLKLIGHGGDVGIVVRLGDEERGVDAYRGYYIGLRSADSALVIGRADHGWMEGQPVPLHGGVSHGVWYHLHIVAYECMIGAEATNIQTRQTAWAAFQDQPCFARGKIGLRSLDTGGAWRNLSVDTANEQALQNILIHASFVMKPEYPAKEADYSRMRETYFKDTYSPMRSYHNFSVGEPPDEQPGLVTSTAVPIDSLDTLPSGTQTVTVHGVVTLTSPLYVQDSSGSILVENDNTAELNLGDEVEVSGRPILEGFTSKLRATGLRLLWDRTPVVPVSITSSQAASGNFDGSLVELRGVLAAKTRQADQTITLQLYDSAQAFTVKVRGGLPMQNYESWEPGSGLLIRGICTLPAAVGGSHTAFTILTRGMDDVQVLNGPPWWTGKQLVRLLILTLLVVCCVVYLYLHLERWKMGAILGERERLAHEMHDTLAQSFAGIGFHLQGLYNGMRTGKTRPSEAISMLHSACEMVAQSHGDASASIAALHPDADHGGDFLVALDHSTRELLHSRNDASMPIRFVREGSPRPLSTPVRDALFHIGREAIANMLRHAHAVNMELSLRYEPKLVILVIRDDGIGFQDSQQSAGFGIRGMQRRCTKIGARMELETAPGHGTCITIRAPYGLRPRLTQWIRSLRKSGRDVLAG